MSASIVFLAVRRMGRLYRWFSGWLALHDGPTIPILIACLAAACLASTAVKAADLAQWSSDPLSSTPPVLMVGPVLPGDATPIVCPTQVELTRSLVLADALDIALCRNPQIKTAWAAIKIQSAAVGEARSAYLPSATGTVSHLQTTTRYPDIKPSSSTNSGQTAYLNLSWRLLDFGTRSANLNAAEQALRAALSGHDAELQKVLSAVINAWFDALTTLGSARERTESSRLAQDTMAATQRREVRGAAGQNDALQAKAALARARLEEQRAIGEARKALAILGVTMGLPPDTPLQLTVSPDVQHTEAIRTLSTWLADAEQAHPALQAAQARLASAQAKVEAVRAEGLPTLDLVSNYYQNGYPNQGLPASRSTTTTVGVTLTIPFFDGFARGYKIRGAQAQVEQSQAQQLETQYQVMTQIVRAHSDAVAAQENIVSSNALLTDALAALLSSQRRYANGASDILELLTMQAALAEARQEKVRSQAEWRSATLRLLANAGMLNRVSALKD